MVVLEAETWFGSIGMFIIVMLWLFRETFTEWYRDAMTYFRERQERALKHEKDLAQLELEKQREINRSLEGYQQSREPVKVKRKKELE